MRVPLCSLPAPRLNRNRCQSPEGGTPFVCPGDLYPKSTGVTPNLASAECVRPRRSCADLEVPDRRS
jgi:hypothetical protein